MVVQQQWPWHWEFAKLSVLYIFTKWRTQPGIVTRSMADLNTKDLYHTEGTSSPRAGLLQISFYELLREWIHTKIKNKVHGCLHATQCSQRTKSTQSFLPPTRDQSRTREKYATYSISYTLQQIMEKPDPHCHRNLWALACWGRTMGSSGPGEIREWKDDDHTLVSYSNNIA